MYKGIPTRHIPYTHEYLNVICRCYIDVTKTSKPMKHIRNWAIEEVNRDITLIIQIAKS